MLFYLIESDTPPPPDPSPDINKMEAGGGHCTKSNQMKQENCNRISLHCGTSRKVSFSFSFPSFFCFSFCSRFLREVWCEGVSVLWQCQTSLSLPSTRCQLLWLVKSNGIQKPRVFWGILKWRGEKVTRACNKVIRAVRYLQKPVTWIRAVRYLQTPVTWIRAVRYLQKFSNANQNFQVPSDTSNVNLGQYFYTSFSLTLSDMFHDAGNFITSNTSLSRKTSILNLPESRGQQLGRSTHCTAPLEVPWPYLYC